MPSVDDKVSWDDSADLVALANALVMGGSWSSCKIPPVGP
jgi:hypothetical protein